MSITVVALLRCRPDRRGKVLAEVLAGVPDVLAEEGCLAYTPHTVGSDSVLVVESWESKEHLAAHAATPAFAALNANTTPLLTSPMEVVVGRPVRGPDAA